jgi:hypothetical protein
MNGAVVIGVLVVVVLLIVFALWVMKPDPYDPTQAKIPDHMKGEAWRRQEREEERERRRNRGS